MGVSMMNADKGGKHTPTRDEEKKGCLSTVNVGKK